MKEFIANNLFTCTESLFAVQLKMISNCFVYILQCNFFLSNVLKLDRKVEAHLNEVP